MQESFDDLCRILGLGTGPENPNARQVESLISTAEARIMSIQIAVAELQKRTSP